LKAEKDSLDAELGNAVRIYQRFVDSNIALKKRENELQQSINELETKKAELQKRFDGLLSKFHDNKADDSSPYLEIKQDGDISINDVFIPQSNMAINYHQNENGTFHCSQIEPSSNILIFDTKDLFQAFSSLQDQQE
jgi:hypothetical protein